MTVEVCTRISAVLGSAGVVLVQRAEAVSGGLQMMNKLLDARPLPAGHLAEWHQELQDKVKQHPSWFPIRDDVIVPQWAVQVHLASCAAL